MAILYIINVVLVTDVVVMMNMALIVGRSSRRRPVRQHENK